MAAPPPIRRARRLLAALSLALLVPAGCTQDDPATGPGPAPVFRGATGKSRTRAGKARPAEASKPRSAPDRALGENEAWTSSLKGLQKEQRVDTVAQVRAILDRLQHREEAWERVDDALHRDEGGKAVRLANEALRAHWARVDGFRALAVGYDTLEAWTKVKRLVDQGRRLLDTPSVKGLRAVVAARMALTGARYALEDRDPERAAGLARDARQAFPRVRGLAALEARIDMALKERKEKAFRLRSFLALADRARRAVGEGRRTDLERAIALWKQAMEVAPDEERRCAARRAAQRLTYKLVEREVASKR